MKIPAVCLYLSKYFCNDKAMVLPLCGNNCLIFPFSLLMKTYILVVIELVFLQGALCNNF